MTKLPMYAAFAVFTAVAGITGLNRESPGYTTAAEVGNTTVVGSLFRVGPDGQAYPAPGLAVRLFHQQYGWTAPSYTDSTGIYQLMGLNPGPHALVITVGRNPNGQDLTQSYDITIPPVPVFRVAAIRVP